MEKKKLYLKTEFCCMACDRDIASEEIAFVKNMAENDELYKGMNVEGILNGFIKEINEKGGAFLGSYLSELADTDLTPKEQLQVLKIAIDTMMADNKIEYAEIKFFKRIRRRMSVSDVDILPLLPNPNDLEDIQLKATCPEKEDWLLPDIQVPDWSDWNVSFETIQFDKEAMESMNTKNKSDA